MWAGGGVQRGGHASARSSELPSRAACPPNDGRPKPKHTLVKILGGPCPRLVATSAELKRPGVKASPTRGAKETSRSKKLPGFLSCRKSHHFPLTSPPACPPHPPPGDDAPLPQRYTVQHPEQCRVPQRNPRISGAGAQRGQRGCSGTRCAPWEPKGSG